MNLITMSVWFDRMNGAAIEGYEEDVGRRTSVYVHTAHSITTSPYLLQEYGYKSAPHDEVLKLQPQCHVFYNFYTHKKKVFFFALTGYKICPDS